MTQLRLYKIKKYLTFFFVFVLLMQLCLVCYASGAAPDISSTPTQLDAIQRLSWVSVLSVFLNFLVILAAVYGVNLSIITSSKQ